MRPRLRNGSCNSLWKGLVVLNWEPRIEYVGVPLGCRRNFYDVEKYVEVMEEVDYTTFDF